MTKVIGSRRIFSDADDAMCMEFLSAVCDIPGIPMYQELKKYVHHRYTTRYQHCLNVAWYSFVLAKKAGLDAKSCARGAMLHDFYLYESNTKYLPMNGTHKTVHPKVALINAKKYFDLNLVEEDCILHHMWPAVKGKPRTKEGFIVTIADKYAASLEWGSHQVIALPKSVMASIRDRFTCEKP